MDLTVTTLEETVPVLAVRDKRGAKSREPQDKNSFGYTLWLIIGGKTADMTRAADALGIFTSTLSGIIHRNRGITQKFIADKKWREQLARYYPEAWAIHGAAFEKHVETLRDIPPVCDREPENKDSFGHVLWKIIGKDSNKREAAERLGIAKPTISTIFHTSTHVSRQMIEDKKWRTVLALYYPATWAQYKNQFEERARQLRHGRCLGEANAAQDKWCKAAAELVTRVIDAAGDDIEDFVRDVKAPPLRTNDIWTRIQEKDLALPASLFRDALIEVCGLYKLDDRENFFYPEVQVLRMQFGKAFTTMRFAT